MSKFPIPEPALSQHIAVLGKTGSGKTSTAKLIVEHVVARASRVCILDPTKSDWWGMISSADGKKPGLPFTILGGPHGHVPLHAGAGAAIAELVASGALQLSIIDMSDFPPGGVAKFYAAFAPVLLRKMKGVLYLVKEEAHEFAPKERSGIGEENFALHYAKKIATAGRSKGIRMVACSQRVQALHNAVLGSCDTVVVHRMTAPADQEPVAKWLKGNVKDKGLRQQIEDSLPNLKTGTGWVCSGEAGMLELVAFPRIHTFDNSATPDDDSAADSVVTAQVDQAKLRALIGDAVKDAEASDPALLRKRIADLERQLKAGGTRTADDIAAARTDGERVGFDKGANHGYRCGWDEHARAVRDALTALPNLPPTLGARPENPERRVEGRRPAEAVMERRTGTAPSLPRARQIDGRAPANDLGTGGKRRILTALAQYPEGLTTRKLSILTDISQKGGTWRTYLAELRGNGWVAGGRDLLKITDAGVEALGAWEPLPTGDALISYWRNRLGDSGKRKIFDAVVAVYPKSISQEDVSDITGIAMAGGTWRTYMAELRGLEIIEGRGELRACQDLFA